MPWSGASDIRSRASHVARAGGRHLERTLGGQERTRVILVLASILALASADTATVGAAASPLRSALHIDNTDIGLLVTVSSLVAALASLPFGVMADRWNRTRILGIAVATWGVAMVWSASVSTFNGLLLTRLLLGVVTAAAGPIVASLVGDYFEGSERGRIYSYVLTGELVGAGVGFAVTGDIAALSWRAAFVLLALPAFALAWFVLRLPEPVRGGLDPLRPEHADGAGPNPTPANGAAAAGFPEADNDPTGPTDAQRLAAAQGIAPDPDHVLPGAEVQTMGLAAAVRAVLRIRTNVILIIAGACGYFYLTGVATFGAEFVKEQYGIDQALANLLLLVVGGGAVIGVLVSGNLSDKLLKRGFLNARILVAAIAALGATVLFIPALTARSAVTALPYLVLAGLMLSAQNPPIDAARLDIVPPLLWGRAEATRTVLRSLAQALAPVLFGAVSDHVFGGGRGGLQWTFGIMLVSMGASGVILLRAMRTYPRDVATAAESLPPAPAGSSSPDADPLAAPPPAPPTWPSPAPPTPPAQPDSA
jgi:MFS family permease